MLKYGLVILIHAEYYYIVPELAYMARDQLPNAELVLLRGCGHLAFYADPAKYAKAVLDFLG